ncbi:hypothetical protein CLV78_102409 [Aliiruegeria haliotis]|uniref:Tetratricopeptide repeat protein n=1 Tax=Aliiruegeria haliotis TaxID=1280846 RepID=A0A2T0RVS7_9RHOB|nr:hypothetical protein [Aliiruegeria haliotis]PRY25232.1 hypothetical protein CLV78_102409 [Aliiruegeria haliotis]
MLSPDVLPDQQDNSDAEGPTGLLHDGAFVQVIHTPAADPSGARSIVYFDSERSPGAAEAFRSGMIRPGEYHVYEIVPKAPHWYPSREMQEVCALLAARVGSDALAFGVSMGGYGALRYGGAAGCATTLALSPQSDISPSNAGAGSGMFGRHHDPELHAEMAIKPRHLTRHVIVAWDPGDVFDTAQATMIPATDGQFTVSMDHCGHWTGAALVAADGLAPIALAVFAADRLEVARLLRRARRAWPAHLARLSLACTKRGHPEWAFDIASAAIEDHGNQPELDIALASARVSLGKIDEGLQGIERLVVAHPRNQRYWNALVAEYEKLGHDGCVAEVLEIATGQTENFTFCWKLINKLIAMGSFGQARMITELASELWPDRGQQLERTLARLPAMG